MADNECTPAEFLRRFHLPIPATTFYGLIHRSVIPARREGRNWILNIDEALERAKAISAAVVVLRGRSKHGEANDRQAV